jgi:heptosyltransferase I
MANMASDGTPRFLISRMSAVGDTVLTLPLLCALREAYPQAFIAWVVERGAAPMLEGHACLDELLVLPRLWAKSPARIWQLRRQLRALHIDTSLDPQSINKTSLACWLSGAPRRIGLGGDYGKELSRWLNNELVDYRQPHIVDRSLELLGPLGVVWGQAEFRLPYRPAVEARMLRSLAELGLSGRFAIVNPGASWDSKLWPPERYAEVCRHLHRNHQLRTLVVWGGDRERGWAEQIVAGAPGAVVLAPPTDLYELTEVLRAGCLFVGSDTGPLHMAAAAGTPCVSMYGTTRPADCGPYGADHIALQIAYQGGSRHERRQASNDAMRLITVPQVCDACDHVLARGSTQTPSQNAGTAA